MHKSQFKAHLNSHFVRKPDSTVFPIEWSSKWFHQQYDTGIHQDALCSKTQSVRVAFELKKAKHTSGKI
jgi:hypothetical protein